MKNFALGLALLLVMAPTLAFAVAPTVLLTNQYGEKSINRVTGGTLSAASAPANSIISNITGSVAAPTGNTYAGVSAKLLPTQLLTGFTSGAGAVTGADTTLGALQKLTGNTQNLAVISNVLTGFTAGAGTVSAADTVLQAVQKNAGNLQNKTVITNVLTGLVAATGTISSSDTVLSAFNKVAALRAAAQADSVAADVPAMVVDFNLLLAKLRAANLMAP